jgi:hypothetical protein
VAGDLERHITSSSVSPMGSTISTNRRTSATELPVMK